MTPTTAFGTAHFLRLLHRLEEVFQLGFLRSGIAFCSFSLCSFLVFPLCLVISALLRCFTLCLFYRLLSNLAFFLQSTAYGQ